MTTQPAVFESLGKMDELQLDCEHEADVMDPLRGVLLGIVLSAPLWAGLYLLVRAIF